MLRVAGGIVIALSGGQMLNAGEEPDRDEAQASLLNQRGASSLAFYPLTMPITTGPRYHLRGHFAWHEPAE